MPFNKAPILGSTAMGRVFFETDCKTNKNKRLFTIVPVKSCGPEIKKGMRKELAINEYSNT